MLISKFDTAGINENIEKFEDKYSFKFPDQYRKFLINYNGGQTPNTNFKLNRVSSDISGFYGFGKADKYYDYCFLESRSTFKEWLEDSMFPIADNDFGDYIMIDISDETNGRICFYYHDRPKKYIELAEDFKTFIGKCKSKKIGHIRTLEERKKGMIDNGLRDKITPEKLAGWQAEIDEYANIHQEELILD